MASRSTRPCATARWEPDPLILDDQALIVHVRGRGLVVLTGCGHAGIVNIVRYARALTGEDRSTRSSAASTSAGPLFEPVIGPTVDALARLAPDARGARALHRLEGVTASPPASPTPSS